MEPSFATIGRVFDPYGAGGRHGRIFVMRKMRVVNLLANLSVRDRPWRLCSSSFVDTSKIYVVEREHSFPTHLIVCRIELGLARMGSIVFVVVGCVRSATVVCAHILAWRYQHTYLRNANPG